MLQQAPWWHASQSLRAGTRMSVELLDHGLTVRERRGRFFYHRLTRAAEDALLVVVAGVPVVA